MQERGWVYFIQEGERGPVKIGKTIGHPGTRMSTFQTGNSDPLRLLGAIPGYSEKEREIHGRFAHLHRRGEWFEPGKELLAFIDGAKAALEDPDMSAPSNCHGLTEDQMLAILGFIRARTVSAQVEDADITLNMELSRDGECAGEYLRAAATRARDTWIGARTLVEEASSGDTPDADGIAFAIPIQTLKEQVEQLQALIEEAKGVLAKMRGLS